MNLNTKLYDDIDIIQYEDEKPLSWIRNILIMLAVIALATLISFGFRALGFHESNYIMTYILGVLLISNFTNGYLYGVISSVLGVLVFNYFFTEPYYTLLTYSPEYPITFVVMLVVALITSTLATRAKRDSRLAEMREQRIRILYQIEKDLLSANSIEQVVKVTSEDISKLFDSSILVAAADIHGDLSIQYIKGANVYDSDLDKAACREAFQSNAPCGAGTQLFSSSRAYFHPINGQSGVLGVIGISLKNSYILSEGQKAFLETISAQVALVMEREKLYEKQKRSQMEIVKERMRADLLRSVSHDLRTPLTSILGSTSMLLQNYKDINDEVRINFLQGIYEDSEWLNNLVENILKMTRFDEGNIKLNKEMEAVEEIVAESLSRIDKRKGAHEIDVSIPNELIMISADGTLIEQVLVNLLDNAIKYTPEDSKIEVVVIREDHNILFEVSDEGPGIAEKDLPFIFSRFFTTGNVGKSNRRGIGLGLAICKSIVEAHGGKISVQNRPSGGAIFRFTIPFKELTNETTNLNS